MTLRERHLEVSADTFIYPPDTFVCVDRFGRYFLYTYISTRSIECVGYGVSLLRPVVDSTAAAKVEGKDVEPPPNVGLGH